MLLVFKMFSSDSIAKITSMAPGRQWRAFQDQHLWTTTPLTPISEPMTPRLWSSLPLTLRSLQKWFWFTTVGTQRASTRWEPFSLSNCIFCGMNSTGPEKHNWDFRSHWLGWNIYDSRPTTFAFGVQTSLSPSPIEIEWEQ